MARRKNPETEAPADPTVQATQATTDFAQTEDPVREVLDEAKPALMPSPAVSGQAINAPATRRSSIVGPLMGGALAAVAGFGLSHFNAFGLSGPDNSAELRALSARLQALEAAPTPDPVDLSGLKDAVSGLQSRIATLEAAPVPPSPDLSGLYALDQRLAAIEALPSGADASTAALAAKLAEVERRLAALPQGGVDTAEIDATLARLEAAEAEATARATAAAEAATAAERAVALDRLRAAAASGAAFDAELAALGDAELTAALAPHAAGVATVAALQAQFPDLVRAALDLARAAEGDQGWGARVMDFLASQTGARPLTPQEGSTPEAVLSRADFALTEARLADALTELATLPPDVQAVFADWTALATARLAVDTALEAE